MFKHVKVTTKTSEWETSISPNMENHEIEKYFLNTFFDVGVYPVEKMEKVIKVEFLYNANFTGVNVGSLGTAQNFKDVKVFAEDKEAARVNLYADYEHISNLEIKQFLD